MLGWFVGQVMKETGGKANPQAVNELLKAKLGHLTASLGSARRLNGAPVAPPIVRWCRRLSPGAPSMAAVSTKTPIDLYYWPTPNGHKITILLEEVGCPTDRSR